MSNFLNLMQNTPLALVHRAYRRHEGLRKVKLKLLTSLCRCLREQGSADVGEHQSLPVPAKQMKLAKPEMTQPLEEAYLNYIHVFVLLSLTSSFTF